MFVHILMPKSIKEMLEQQLDKKNKELSVKDRQRYATI
jgi:hypothetical protein